MSDKENTPQSKPKSQTTFHNHFNSFNDKMPLKEKLHNLCLLEQNNYFIDQPLTSLDHVNDNIKPIKQVPSNFRALNKWRCLMNQKLNFVWKNMDKDFCQEFKNQLDKFTSVDNAYGLATKLNREHNPQYKSNQSTSLGSKIRKKTTHDSQDAIPPASTASITSNTSSIDKEQNKLDFQVILNRYKDEARLGVAENLNELNQVCKMTKLNLYSKISENYGSDSDEWVKAILGDKANHLTATSKCENLLLYNILTIFHDIIDDVTCEKNFIEQVDSNKSDK